VRSRSDVDRWNSAVDAVEALSLLDECAYDVLLLDIQMPEVSGIDLMDRLRERKEALPSIVFVTAHSEHAVTAFEKRAADYVLKPFCDERVHDALDSAARRSQAERSAQFFEILPQLERLVKNPSRIAIKTKGSILFVDPAEVAVVEAQGNYVLLQRPSGSHLLRESISVIAPKLEAYGFVRIHRSILVNGSFVEEIHPWTTGEYVLRIKGGKEFAVSRSYKKNLSALARFWVGSKAFLQE
jgi:two-component system, LytTR family, response regulator